jgi:hypothetical protein
MISVVDCTVCDMSCHTNTVTVRCNFTRDTGYVLPGFSLDTVDKDRVKFSIVISSENLLLNLYRVYKSPQRLTIVLDHTYRLLAGKWHTRRVSDTFDVVDTISLRKTLCDT